MLVLSLAFTSSSGKGLAALGASQEQQNRLCTRLFWDTPHFGVQLIGGESQDLADIGGAQLARDLSPGAHQGGKESPGPTAL